MYTNEQIGSITQGLYQHCSIDAKDDIVNLEDMLLDLRAENERLREAIQKTLDENKFLVRGGHNCALKHLLALERR